MVIEGLALAIYKDREALEQSTRSLREGGKATKKRSDCTKGLRAEAAADEEYKTPK